MDITLLQSSPSSNIFITSYCFNPCFNGYYTSTIKTGTQFVQKLLNVSILVLMDITLLHKLLLKGEVEDLGFNPCFNGYYTSTLCNVIPNAVLYTVSILVLMDITLLHDIDTFTEFMKTKFQSLF